MTKQGQKDSMSQDFNSVAIMTTPTSSRIGSKYYETDDDDDKECSGDITERTASTCALSVSNCSEDPTSITPGGPSSSSENNNKPIRRGRRPRQQRQHGHAYCVQFRLVPRVHKVKSLKDYTTKEHRRCWYNSEDNKKSERRRLKVLSRLEANKVCKDDQSYRGLQNHSLEGKKVMTDNIVKCIRAVLREQRLQRKIRHSSLIDASGRITVIDKCDRIAAVSQRCSRHCIQGAILRAKQDAIDAAEELEECWQMWEKQLDKQKQEARWQSACSQSQQTKTKSNNVVAQKDSNDDEDEDDDNDDTTGHGGDDEDSVPAAAALQQRPPLRIQNSLRLVKKRQEQLQRRRGRKVDQVFSGGATLTMSVLPLQGDVSPYAPRRMTSLRKLDIAVSDDDASDNDISKLPPLIPQRMSSIRKLSISSSSNNSENSGENNGSSREVVQDIDGNDDDNDDGSGGLLSGRSTDEASQKKKAQYDCHDPKPPKKQSSLRNLLQKSLSISKLETGGGSKSSGSSSPTSSVTSVKSLSRRPSLTKALSFTKGYNKLPSGEQDEQQQQKKNNKEGGRPPLSSLGGSFKMTKKMVRQVPKKLIGGARTG